MGGPVTLDATVLDAERLQTELGGLNILRQLEQVFAEAAIASDAEVSDVVATELPDGFLVEATLIAAVRPLSEEILGEIQDQLEEAVNDSVELSVLSVAGNRVELSGNEWTVQVV
jgi:hypothetical protein